MCGRFTLTSPSDQIDDLLKVVSPEWSPRYNIAPSQDVIVVTSDSGRRSASLMRWGLIPTWAKDESIGNRCINARAETVAQKPAFRNAYRHRRCLIPANGFYEWRQTKVKKPFYIGIDGFELMAFGGLWEEWTRQDGSKVSSCSIITVAPNPMIASFHDRMPLILDPTNWLDWLRADASPETIDSLLQTYDEAKMTMHGVNSRVGNVMNDDASLIEPEEDPQQTLF